MSVIVMGMSVPGSCNKCQFSFNGWCWAFHKKANGREMSNRVRADWCPIRPLPEKHGRLIDADAYAAEMKERQDNAMLWKEKAARNNDMTIFARGDQAIRTFSEAKLTLDNMPAIVEAEED